MAPAPRVSFTGFSSPESGVLVVLTDDSLAFGPETQTLLGDAAALVARAAKAEGFKGRMGTTLQLSVPQGLSIDRLVVVGTSDAKEKSGKAGKGKTQPSVTPPDAIRIGGAAMGVMSKSSSAMTIVAEWPSGAMTPDEAANVALGVRLRGYTFDRYKTKRKDDDEKADAAEVRIAVQDPAAVKRANARGNALAEGVTLARDLVNEPANILYPEEFARRAEGLRKVGVKVEVLDTKAMKKLGMGALLGVAQGSVREGRVVVMEWNGGKSGEKPVGFIGKGVTFDTGGISIKPAAGMEDMKGDMAGAACVVGLMHALAARKAKVNALGIIGLVENMPDGNAQRPGDIVTSMSGQTIEIINTDAEGRLVLADCLWYAAKTYKPQFMVNLATLTGAIIIALGQEYAGLFSNNDELSERLSAAGKETGELVWRMPLAPAYDKMIDSKFADMKNTGGSRWAGSITAAQFLQRFVEDTPWAHLDIAGTGMDSRQTDINRSWGSGWGVRLLDRLVADHYER